MLLTLRPHEVRFPDRCVRCSGAPDQTLVLETVRGVDALVMAVRRRMEVQAPLCSRCLGRHHSRRVMWHLGLLAALILLIVIPMAVSAGFAGGEPPPVVMALVLPLTLGWIWFWRNREQDLFHRWFSPVAITAWRIDSDEIDLSFKTEALWQDVGLLSGKLDRGALGRATSGKGYREAAMAQVPQQWSGPRERSASYWWLPGAFGLACFLGAGYVWWQAILAEEMGRPFRNHFLVVLLYNVGGTVAAVTPFIVIGVAGIALTLVLLARGIGVGGRR